MHRPYVTINCAMSADGKIASPSGKQMRISCDEDIERMYRMRNDSDAVLVGIETVLSDDPKLTVKKACVLEVKNPIRVILDTHCKTPESALVVNKDAKTLIFAGKKCDRKYGGNVEIIQCETDENNLIDLNKMLEILFKRGINNLMVEGGSRVIWSFLKNKLVDEMFVYIGPIIIGGDKTPTLAGGKGIKNEPILLEVIDVQYMGSGILVQYKMVK